METYKELFHTSSDTDFLKSFMNDGIKTIGKGEGGQADGFYVFENKDWALSHAVFKSHQKGDERELKNNQGLIIGVKAPTKEFRYPLWQFDYERAPDLATLMDKYWKEACMVMASDFKTGPLLLTGGVPKESGVFHVIYNDGFNRDISIKQNNGGDDTYIFQHIFDKLCTTNEEFLKEYNHLLLNSPNTAKKYTGKEKLPISYISAVSVDGDTVKEETLYTDKKEKEQQICPFFKLQKLKSTTKTTTTLRGTLMRHSVDNAKKVSIRSKGKSIMP